jgi:isoquinoline 1-oxidoreductase beta subunit
VLLTWHRTPEVTAHVITRRSFLKAAGVSAGGLAVGVTLPFGGRADQSAETELTAFVHIAPNGDTTIYCGRCEMGQGIATALPAAVADELEADWERIQVLQADANEAKFGPQATGGSNSINQMFVPMREAGAAARELLVSAAASRWGLSGADCYAELHFVRNRLDQRRLPYGDLVEDAARLTAPSKPGLKSPAQWRYIGRPMPSRDLPKIVTGQRIFGADTRVPGMKYAAIRHVPVMGGSVRQYNADAARAMPGVADIILIPRFKSPYGSVGGVAVIADSTWRAQNALDKVQIDWDRGAHGRYDTELYKKQLVDNVEQPGEITHERGNLDIAQDKAADHYSASYVCAHLSHSPMEPMSSTVWVRESSCEVWASTQDPASIQQTLAAFLGMEPDDVTVHVMISGGAFGRKFKCDYVQEAAACSKAVGAPVHLTWSREEDTRTGYYHSVSAQHIEATMDADGKVTGWLQRVAFPSIASTFDARVEQPTKNDLNALWDHPYGIENLRIESSSAPAHTRIGWYRAVYAIFYGFAVNVFTDELAARAGVDPLDFYRKLLSGNSAGELKEKADRSLGVLELAAAKAGWGKTLPEGHGLGLAVHHSFESYIAMVVHAQVNGDDIKVHRVDCAVDCGLVLNPDQATAQMEGAVIMGLSLALNTEISFKEGAVVNSNFHDYPVLRMPEAPPEIKVHFTYTGARPTGLGEPGVPTLAPALINAVFAASGKRFRNLPLKPLA